MHWTGLLYKNNPHYSDVELNFHALNSLPENSVPQEIISLEADETVIHEQFNCNADRGPASSDDEVVYDSHTDSSSFLPVNRQQQETDLIQQQLLHGHVDWPTLDITH